MGSLPMIIKASGRSALMVVTGLFVCLAGVSYTAAATEAASSNSESATATKSVKHSSHHWKRYAHRKHVRTADKSSTVKKAEEKEVADAAGEVPVSLPPQVANANARIDSAHRQRGENRGNKYIASEMEAGDLSQHRRLPRWECDCDSTE